jgi:WD40 repeat protein
MKQIEHNNLKVYTNTNQWYNIKYSPNSKDLSVEESNLNDIDNNSSKFANSYTINNEEFPLIIYDKGKYLLKGGFWDGRIERNSLITEKKDEIFSKTYFNNIGGCITIMEMTKKENDLLCGTKEGCLLSFKVEKSNIELINSLFIHSEPIVSISINDSLNMCATSSKDGYVMIYTFPAFDLIRSIHIPSLFKDESEFLYADNIFLSNSPLPCITVFISKKRLFKIFTINGHFMQDLEEDKEVNCIKSPFVFTSFDFQDYLIYGTNNGLVKIRRFPEMELVNQANPFNNNKSIECLCLSLDNRYCFAWSSSNEIAVISNCFSK